MRWPRPCRIFSNNPLRGKAGQSDGDACPFSVSIPYRPRTTGRRMPVFFITDPAVSEPAFRRLSRRLHESLSVQHSERTGTWRFMFAMGLPGPRHKETRTRCGLSNRSIVEGLLFKNQRPDLTVQFPHMLLVTSNLAVQNRMQKLRAWLIKEHPDPPKPLACFAVNRPPPRGAQWLKRTAKPFDRTLALQPRRGTKFAQPAPLGRLTAPPRLRRGCS